MERIIDNFGIIDIDNAPPQAKKEMGGYPAEIIESIWVDYKAGDKVRFMTAEEMAFFWRGASKNFHPHMGHLLGIDFRTTGEITERLMRRSERISFMVDERGNEWHINITMLIPKNFKIKEDFKPQVEPLKKEPPEKAVVPDRVVDKEIINKMISMVDKKSLVALIKLASRGTKISDDVVNWYLNEWANAKYEHFLMLNQKLSYSKTVESIISEKDMSQLIVDFKRENSESYLWIYNPLLDAIPVSFFVQNKLGDCPEKIKECFSAYKKGMKLSKFLSGYFRDTKFDIEFSKLMQKRVVKGGMSISIDPIDYLTCAINKNGWTTCSSIYTGCYASGPFSQMLDEDTLVCYQASDTIYDYAISGQTFKANSKSARAFVLRSKETGAFAVARAYPNCSNEGFYVAVKDFCQETFSSLSGCSKDWLTEVVTKNMDNGSCSGTYDLVDARRFHKNRNKDYVKPGGHMVFADPIKFVCSQKDEKIRKFVLGVETMKCPVCGKEIQKLKGKQALVCETC